jgi:hypothetical protein
LKTECCGAPLVEEDNCREIIIMIMIIIKDKAIPVQTWTGQSCSRKLKLPEYKIIDT